MFEKYNLRDKKWETQSYKSYSLRYLPTYMNIYIWLEGSVEYPISPLNDVQKSDVQKSEQMQDQISHVRVTSVFSCAAEMRQLGIYIIALKLAYSRSVCSKMYLKII